MSNVSKIAVMTGVASLLLVSGATAQLLAHYVDGADYNDNATPPVAGSTAVDMTAENMSYKGIGGGSQGNIRSAYGDVVWPDIGAGTFAHVSGRAYNGLSADPGPETEPTDDYVEFTLTADAGKAIDLSSFTFNWGLGDNNSTLSNAVAGVRVYASVDGASFTSFGSASVTQAVVTLKTWYPQTALNIDLGGLGETYAGDSVKIRVQGWLGAAGTSSGSVLVFDSYKFYGSVVDSSTTPPLPDELAIYTFDIDGAASYANSGSHPLCTVSDYDDLGLGVISGYGPLQITGPKTLAYQLTNITSSNDVSVADIVGTFVVTPNAEEDLALNSTDSVTLDFAGHQKIANSNLTVNTRIFVASDAAFTSILATSDLFSVTDIGNGDNITISSAQLNAAISFSDPLYFGIGVTVEDEAAADNGNIRIDNIVVNGTTAAPMLPATVAINYSVGNGLELSWTNQQGKTFNIETNTVLTTTNWSEWMTGITSTDIIITNAVPTTGDQTFYRVITTPAP